MRNDGGLYGSDDAGRGWSKLLDGFVRAVALDPSDENVVYAGTEPVGLFRSEDRGKTWEELSALHELPDEVRARWWFPVPPHLGHVCDIFIHPADSRIIYLALEHGGIVRSYDRGANWEDVSEGIDYPDIHVVEALPGSTTRYFAATAKGFYTSADPAAGWTRAEQGLTRDYFHDFIFFLPANGGDRTTILLATADNTPAAWDRPEFACSALFRSEDGAESWQRVTRGLPDILRPMVWGLANHPADSDSAFAALGAASRSSGKVNAAVPGTLMETKDRGQSWQELPFQMPAPLVLWAGAA
jgi:photosystem II stability/assembly factor-like uncharacterized protein